MKYKIVDMTAYHAETDIRSRLFCDGVRRVRFRADGTPCFRVSAEEDLPEDQRKIRIRVNTHFRG